MSMYHMRSNQGSSQTSMQPKFHSMSTIQRHRSSSLYLNLSPCFFRQFKRDKKNKQDNCLHTSWDRVKIVEPSLPVCVGLSDVEDGRVDCSQGIYDGSWRIRCGRWLCRPFLGDLDNGFRRIRCGRWSCGLFPGDLDDGFQRKVLLS